jgi:outer membrane protein OmpA-like peptidoglycan-associated protein
VPSEADSIELFAPSELIDKPFYYTNSNDSFPKGINEEVFANLVATLKMNPGSSLIIGVYTDEKSREQENIKISQQRAEYIATKLEKEYAFPPESMFAMGMGGKFPLEQKSKKSSSKENRRLVFGILKLE